MRGECEPYRIHFADAKDAGVSDKVRWRRCCGSTHMIDYGRRSYNKTTKKSQPLERLVLHMSRACIGRKCYGPVKLRQRPLSRKPTPHNHVRVRLE